MATYRGGAYLESAIRSVLAQSLRALELIVVDDASGDGSAERLGALAAADPRLVPLSLDTNRGPAGARNAGLEAARGEWIAVVDSDDLLHPERIERLLAAAEATGADMVADDMVHFGAPGAAGGTLLDQMEIDGARRISAADLVASDTVSTGLQSLGYLKPLIRRDALDGLRYDEQLKIGEDFDLYLRLLLGGACLFVVPEPTYLYRRHAVSTSHRLSVRALEAQLAAHGRVVAAAGRQRSGDKQLQEALDRRGRALARALRYEHLVEALKSRRAGRSAGLLLRHPALLGNLGESLADRGRRKRTAASLPARPERAASCIVLAAEGESPPIDAPADAFRLSVPAPAEPTRGNLEGMRALACRLAVLSEEGPIDVLAVGTAGLRGLGYVPRWRSARLFLAAGAARDAVVPEGVALEILPGAA